MKQIAGVARTLSMALAMLFVLAAVTGAEVAPTARVKGWVSHDKQRIELTGVEAYPSYPMIRVLLTDGQVPEGRGKAFADQALEGTGLKGVEIGLWVPGAAEAEGKPPLAWARFYAGDGMMSYQSCGTPDYVFVQTSLSREQVAGRLHGTIVHTPERIDVDVTFLAPVKEPPATEPLPQGGGAPGKAFRSFLEAVRAKNLEQVRQHCTTIVRRMYADDEDAEGMIDSLNEDLAGRKVQVVGGSLDHERATLRVEMVGRDDTNTETVNLALEDGEWRIAD